MDYVLIENLMGNNILNRLYNLTTSTFFPWFLSSEDISIGSDVKLLDDKFDKYKTVGFSHTLMMENYRSEYLPTFLPVLDYIQDNFKYPLNFYNLRACLQLNNGNSHHNFPHIDNQFDHYSAIFYLHDSSGDTVFFDRYRKNFDEKLKNKNNLEHYIDEYTDEYVITHRVSPKRNNLCIFNGNQYHASSNPTTNQYRIILNICFTTESNIFEENR